jgi:hypothetical protein
MQHVFPAVVQLVQQMHFSRFVPRARRHAHRDNRTNDGDVGDGVDGEAPAFTKGGNQHAADGGTNNTRAIDHRGVERDGIRQVTPVLDHFAHKRLARGRVERVDDALNHLQPDDLPHGDDVRERQYREQRGLEKRPHLRPQQDPPSVVPIDQHARERRDDQRRDLTGEPRHAEQELRPGQPVDKPARRNTCDPGADEGNALTAEEEAEVAMLQGARQAPRGRGHDPILVEPLVLQTANEADDQVGYRSGLIDVR